MRSSKVQFFIDYVKMLIHEHRNEIILSPVTIITIIASAVTTQSFNFGYGFAIFLLCVHIFLLLYDTYQSTKATTFGANSGYSICLGKDEGFYKYNVRKQIQTLENQKVNLSKVEKHFKLIDTDWQYHNENILAPSEWGNNVKEISNHFFRYSRRLPINTNLYLFVIAPIPMVLGLGFTLGKYQNWKIYHFSNSMYQLISFESKTAAKNGLDYIDIKDNGVNDSEVTMILSFVPPASVPLPKLTENLIEITPKSQGTLLAPEDFPHIVEEIVRFLHEVAKRRSLIHLFAGIPLSLAFLLGKMLDENVNVTIYNPNYETQSWDSVLNLQTLK